MADNDIFRKHVNKHFQYASRAVVRYGDIDKGIRKAIQVCNPDSLGCTSTTIQLLRKIHAEACIAHLSVPERDRCVNRIDELGEPSQPEIIKTAARTAVDAIRLGKFVPGEFADFAAIVIAEHISAQMFALPAISAAVTEYGRTHEEILRDKNKFENELTGNLNFRATVLELISYPEASFHTRSRPQKPSLQSLLDTPLLELAS